MIKIIYLSVVILITLVKDIEAQYDPEQRSKWTLITSVQATGGGFIYNDYSSLYLLYGGLRYQTDDWSVYGYIPLVAQNNSGFTQSGMMILPTGSGTDQSINGGHHTGGNHMTGMSMVNLNFSLGDLFVYGSYRLLNEYDNPVELSITPGIKFPTAVGSSGVGTGKFDYSISATARKSFETFVFLADAGFIKFGDPAGINYNDPFTYGMGIGKFISDSGNNFLLYFSSYTKILDDYDPPRQLSLGFNFNLWHSMILSVIGSKGFGNYSPAFTASVGISLGL